MIWYRLLYIAIGNMNWTEPYCYGVLYAILDVNKRNSFGTFVSLHPKYQANQGKYRPGLRKKTWLNWIIKYTIQNIYHSLNNKHFLVNNDNEYSNSKRILIQNLVYMFSKFNKNIPLSIEYSDWTQITVVTKYT